MHFVGNIEKNETFMSLMTARQRELLTDYAEHLNQLRVCIEHNHEIIKLILQDDSMFENSRHDKQEYGALSRPNLSEMDTVSSVPRQVVRDWSADGETERRQCYQPIIDELCARLPSTGDAPLSAVRVLVPGAGLGRLAFEIAKLGYACQGNEFALFMLFASNFVLNRCRGTHLCRLHPWCTTHASHLTPGDRTAGVTFPDSDPSQLAADVPFSMAAGDFLEVYTEPEQWHCVATCFFIDCANNVVQFVETIYSSGSQPFWVDSPPDAHLILYSPPPHPPPPTRIPYASRRHKITVFSILLCIASDTHIRHKNETRKNSISSDKCHMSYVSYVWQSVQCGTGSQCESVALAVSAMVALASSPRVFRFSAQSWTLNT